MQCANLASQEDKLELYLESAYIHEAVKLYKIIYEIHELLHIVMPFMAESGFISKGLAVIRWGYDFDVLSNYFICQNLD